MKNHTSLLLFLFLITFNSNKLQSQSEVRDVGPYQGIRIEGPYKVTLTTGTEGKLTFEGNRSDLDKIESYVKKGILIIKKENTSWFSDWKSDLVSIRIPVEQINQIILTGSGDIQAETILKTPRLKIIISGSGNINLEVNTPSLNGIVTGSGELKLSGLSAQIGFTVTGSGSIEASALKSQFGKAQITGSGDINMQVTEEINGQVTGSGDITCFGNSKHQKIKITGSGDIRIKN